MQGIQYILIFDLINIYYGKYKNNICYNLVK